MPTQCIVIKDGVNKNRVLYKYIQGNHDYRKLTRVTLPQKVILVDIYRCAGLMRNHMEKRNTTNNKDRCPLVTTVDVIGLPNKGDNRRYGLVLENQLERKLVSRVIDGRGDILISS